MSSKKTSPSRPQWASRLGFIFSAAGAAVGLGNLQRFPQVVGENGGGAFLLLYLFCVAFFGWPLMLAEFALGRAGRTNPIRSFEVVTPTRRAWRLVGGLGILVVFCIHTYYMVACAWVLTYAVKGISGATLAFDEVVKQPQLVFPYQLVFHGVTTLVVLRGLNKGVERFSKIVMPLLLVIQLLLIGRILLLDGSWEGVLYYLKPNFDQLRGDSLMRALSQAFYSLCIGEAVLLTYGSFSKKSTSLPTAAGYISAFDTTIAFLAGLIIFPAAFALRQDPAQGTSLMYSVLNQLFQSLPGGALLQTAYFSMLTIAGLTTCITFLEVGSHTLHQVWHWPKRRCVGLLSLLALLISLPSLFGQGAIPALSNLQLRHAKGVYGIMDFICGDLGMVTVGLLTTLFVGWVWGAEKAATELSLNAPHFAKISKLWQAHIKWIAPPLIIAILSSLLFV